MERIQNETTALNSMGLTIDLVRKGECLEFDAEKKINRKKQYTLLEPVGKVIDLYTKDLQAAYNMIEQLEAELADSKKALDEVTEAARTSAQQVKMVLAGEKKFGEAENRLAELMASVEQLRQSHADDGALIANLRQQIKDAQELADTVPALASDVQFVLDALEKSLADAGLDIDDILKDVE